MSAYELAQMNIGIIKAPMDSPVMAGFAGNLDRINAVAEASPGFVWRLQTDEGNATSIRPFERDDLLVNMSVWRDVQLAQRVRLHVGARRADAPPARVVRADGRGVSRALVGAGRTPADGGGRHRATRDAARARLDRGSVHVPQCIPAARRSARRKRRRSCGGECPAT